jgi:hypothetical protein
MSDTDTATLTDQDLFMGAPLPGADLVIGEDLYDEPDPEDSSYRGEVDPISAAVGTSGFMGNHIVQACYFQTAEGATTEPEEFDRYYFAPGDRPYEGPAPVLIDILAGDDPELAAREHDEKHVDFKAQWCREHGVRYVVLADTDDMLLSTTELRAKLLGESPTTPPLTAEVAAEAAASKPERKRGVQRPRLAGRIDHDPQA